jgi:NhaP-type Na+/H+ or K+/H+ antiporter
MVHLFGDWFGDIVAIFIIFVIYLFLRINTKEKKTWDRLDFFFSLAVFIVAACEIVGSIIFMDFYYGPSEGFLVMIGIMIITLISGTVAGIELRAGKKFW